MRKRNNLKLAETAAIETSLQQLQKNFAFRNYMSRIYHDDPGVRWFAAKEIPLEYVPWMFVIETSEENLNILKWRMSNGK